MSNILNFIEEYGGIDFDTMPFNEVDSLVLSQLSYSDLKVVSNIFGSPFTIEFLGKDDIAKRMSSITWFPKLDYKLIKLMSIAPRYKNLEITDFYESENYSKDGQFTAYTTKICESIRALIFRGTDASFSGWAESMAMSCDEEILAQASAKKYLELISDKYQESFIMAGHSKGGNLVVFSASTVDKSIQDRIIKIYNLDGPGFLPEFYKRQDYNSVEHRIEVFMPKKSIVGLLLEGVGKVHVIESRGLFIEQHSPFKWLVKDGVFQELLHVDPISNITKNSINRWFQLVDRKERQEIINLLYNILSHTGASDIKEILNSKLNNFFKIRSALNTMGEDDYNLLKQSLDELFKIMKEEAIDHIRK